MAKRSYPSNDFYKHRDGPKRQARINEWYENKQGHAEAKNFFSAENVVPNNPTNYQSFTPVASQFAPQGQPAGDVVFRRNPYGDAEQIVQSEGPSYRRPTQMGQYFQAPDTDPKLDRPNFLATPGPGSEMSEGRITAGGGFMGDRDFYSKTEEERQAYLDSKEYKNYRDAREQEKKAYIEERRGSGFKGKPARKPGRNPGRKPGRRHHLTPGKEARGMRTGFGGFGAGPQRGVEAAEADVRNAAADFRKKMPRG